MMKFGLESEKLLYDLQDQSIYHGVFRLVDAVSDYSQIHGDEIHKRITNEFVLNMVEMNSIASPLQREVIEDYFLLYLILRDVAKRDHVTPLPLSAVPFHFTPTMVPKWQYYVQNSILSSKRLKEWTLSEHSPMADAGNCAGLHVHIEIETPPEFLCLTPELKDKHNLALMLTPLVAFSASPYFLSEHSAYSMRCERYFYGVYEKFPLNGGLPPVFQTSQEVMEYTMQGINYWKQRAVSIGFKTEDIEKLTRRKGANWSMLRWNRSWNTIELRCLESDRVDYDIAKFLTASSIMKLTDLQGEALTPIPLPIQAKLDQALIDQCFEIKNSTISILSTAAIHDLTHRSVQKGLNDPLVKSYLKKLMSLAKPRVDYDCTDLLLPLEEVLNSGETTAQFILHQTNSTKQLNEKNAQPILDELIQRENKAIKHLKTLFPGILAQGRERLFSV